MGKKEVMNKVVFCRRRCALPAAGLRNAPRFSACNVSKGLSYRPYRWPDHTFGDFRRVFSHLNCNFLQEIKKEKSKRNTFLNLRN